MGIRDAIAELRSRIGARLLPAYVSELQAFERALLAGECGLNARWHELRQGLGLEISAAMSRLASFEKALAVVETAERQDAERAPTGKEAAANDQP